MSDNFTRLSVEKATEPIDGEVITKSWWIVDNECLLFYRDHAPQCNKNENIAKKIRDKSFPDADVRYFEVVFIGQERLRREIEYAEQSVLGEALTLL